MTQAYDPNPALFWWEHLTKEQRAFLRDTGGPDYSVESLYQLALTSDLHKLPGWPETPESAFRTI